MGTEVHLAACPLEFNQANATSSCRGGMPAVVSCVPGPQYTPSGMKKKPKTSVRSPCVHTTALAAGTHVLVFVRP